MPNLGFRVDYDLFAGQTQAVTQINIFPIHKIPFVKAMNAGKILFFDQHSGAAISLCCEGKSFKT
ncbi:MAG: hypothetical protein U1E51_30965, partial [Candidatus Binatia bacterium]|nr:hypothetical protein [Candidatus Binatia bacterium]